MDGKVVVVTGASDGVGAAARAFFRHGATVVAVGRSPDKTAQIATYLGTDATLAAALRERSPALLGLGP